MVSAWLRFVFSVLSWVQSSFQIILHGRQRIEDSVHTVWKKNWIPLFEDTCLRYPPINMNLFYTESTNPLACFLRVYLDFVRLREDVGSIISIGNWGHS